jgi:hypothetical protein
MPKYVINLDLAKNQLLNAVIQNLAVAPASPVKGQNYFDTVSNHEYVYNGTGWEQASGGGGSGTVTTVSVATANGFAGTVANPTSTPAITLTTSVTGLLRGNGTAISAAVGTDLPALNTITAPTGPLSLNTQRITNLVDPSAAQDAATKNYVDLSVQGLQIKPTARLATAGALPANTYANGTAGVGATITMTATTALTVDGVAVAVGDLVLVKDEAAPSHNGLFTVTAAGGAAAAVLTRHTDMDQAGDFAGAFIPVGSGGTVNANSLWLCNPTGAVTVGTTAIPFTELNKAADLVAGTGITISGATVSVATTYAGGTSIATVGTITAGTWQGTAVAVGFGGTGATTAAGARTNLAATGKYQATIGDGTTTIFTITQATHGLATDSSIHAMVLDDTSGAFVFPDIAVNKTNGTVTLTFAAAPTTNQYRVVLVG